MIWVIAVIALVIIGLAGAGIYVARNYETLIAKGVTQAIRATISASALPQEAKAEIIAIVEQLKQAYLAGEVTLDELQAVLKSIVASPVLTVGMITQFEESYVVPSALGAEEKQQAHLNLNRFAQGLCSKRIGWESVGKATGPISAMDASGKMRLKSPEECTPDEVRRVLSAIRSFSDQAKIPNTIVAIDISNEFKKSIEEALGRRLA
jgi:hypothetical protein